MLKINEKVIFPLAVSILFFVIYLILPSSNNSIDSWGYAIYIKQARDLFLPHHLLNGAMGLLWVRAINTFIEGDAMRLMLSLNALFAAGILFLLGLTLNALGTNIRKTLVWIFFVGSSWAIMRYATENEVYIFPIFFSLLGSYFFVRFQNTKKTKEILLSGLFAATACLFHQIMFFWWFALFVGVIATKKRKFFLNYSLPALIVPIVYSLVIVFYYNRPFSIESVMHFVFNDYYSGAAGVSTGLSSLILLFVGLIRSFFQVHGYFVNLPTLSSLFYLGAIVSSLFILLSMTQIKRVSLNFSNRKKTNVWVHALAIFLQLFFAFLSSGNSEFMVMIPVLTAIVLSQIIENEKQIVIYIALSMFVWNLSLGLVPLRFYNLDNNKGIAKQVITEENKTEKPLYILFNRPRVENEVEYHLGYCPRNLLTGIQYDDINEIKSQIDSVIYMGVEVYTDCLNRPQTISRETLTIENTFEEKFSDYSYQKTDSISTLTGRYYLYRLLKK